MEKIYGDVVVIGAGPAGMMAAIRAAEAGARVVLLEKNGRVGRKLMITGKGRCNLTNRKVWNDFSPHIHPKPNFFKPAFHFFTNDATVDFFESIGVETVLTRGDRVFPASMKAVTVVDGLSRCLSRHENINLMTDCTVIEVSRCDDDTMSVKFVRSSPNGGAPCSFTVESRAVVVATGGMSYPTTGSTGDGYAFAESLGHTITRLFPSLTALTPRQYDLRLEGVELVNVALSLYVDHDILAHEFGDVQFTDGGIEGPIGFKVSRKAVWALMNGNNVEVVIDLKPAVTLEKFRERVRRDAQNDNEVKGRITLPKMQKFMRKYMPEQLVAPFYDSCIGLTPDTLAQNMKNWRFRIADYVGYRRAVVTAGGINSAEIFSKTMQSRNVRGLFFAGEILDLDGDTGGYNLQIAFSTGALAGEMAARYATGSETSTELFI